MLVVANLVPTPVRRAPRWKRWAGGALAVAVLAVTAMHLPLARRWLAARGPTGGAVCPFGYGGAPTDAGRAAQRQHLASLRGAAIARERPALGFALDRTTAADLARWAAAHGVRCEPRHAGTLVECTAVPGAVVPGAGALGFTSLVFQLGDDGTLAAIRAVRRDRDAGIVAAAFAAQEHQLTERAGAPVTRGGATDTLAGATLRQAMVEYRFTDYRAVVRATNMGDGFVLTEEYATLARS